MQKAEAALRESGQNELADKVALEWMSYDAKTDDPDFLDRLEEE